MYVWEREIGTWKINQLLKVMVTFVNSEIRAFLHILLCSISKWLYNHQNEIVLLHCPYACRILIYPNTGFFILYLSYFPPYINLYLMCQSNKYNTKRLLWRKKRKVLWLIFFSMICLIFISLVLSHCFISFELLSVLMQYFSRLLNDICWRNFNKENYNMMWLYK